MESKNESAKMESDIMAHLSGSKLSKAHLSRISKSIAANQSSGFKLVDWWIFGIPAFERFVTESQIAIDKSEMLGKLIAKGEFDEIRIFRKGIPKPDFFQVQITVDHHQNR